MKITLNPLATLCLVTLFLLSGCNDHAPPENKAAAPATESKPAEAAQPAAAQPAAAQPQPATPIDKAKEANQATENSTTEKKEEIDKQK